MIRPYRTAFTPIRRASALGVARLATLTALAAIPVVTSAACKGAPADTLDASPSPQAKAEPAPLANPPSPTATASAAAPGPDGGVVPESLRTDRALAPDAPRDVVSVKDPGTKEVTRDLSGYALQAIVRTGEGPGPTRTAEVNTAAVETARRRTEARIALSLSQVRARFVLSGGFVLPQGAELRARADSYGHILLVPGEDTYRVVPPGALRALLGERRLDVAPVTHANTSPAGEGPRRAGVPTRRVDVSTRAAKATFELGTLRDAGEGGTLVCRWLLDLMSAPPSTTVCATDEVPLHAELRWSTRGALVFDVVSLTRRIDLAAQDLAVPPSAAAFTSAPLPVPPSDVILPRAELASLRTVPVDAPQAQVASDAQPPPPESGLLLVNTTDELRVAWVDGFVAAWVAPGGRALLPSLVRGRYAVQWRTFLGDAWDTPETVLTPATNDAAGARTP
jgi:hypothetical protein